MILKEYKAKSKCEFLLELDISVTFFPVLSKVKFDMENI